jgi:1-acyl-sn-glycerol-3-phosphate acyltransferase
MARSKRLLKAGLIGLMFLAGLLAVTLAFPLASLCGPRAARRLRGRIAMDWYAGLARILNLKLRRFGEPMAAVGLTVGNHVSWLDIVALGSQAPFDFIAKREVADWPVVGYLGKRAGTLFVSRGDRGSSLGVAEDMAWRLRQGRRLALFPEGTSTMGAGVLRFHARLFQPALLVHVPVQPVAIAYRGKAARLAPFVGDDDFLPHLWRLLALDSIEVDLSFCPPLAPGSLDRDSLARHARAQIAAALELERPARQLTA